MTRIQLPFQVRGYEVDSSRTTPLPVILSFLEQTRWLWMTDPDWGLLHALHGGHFFVMRRQTLELLERPRFGDEVVIDARMAKVGRSLVEVEHILRMNDVPIGKARVIGVLLGPNRRLARLPDSVRTLGRVEADLPSVELSALPPPETGDGTSYLTPPRRVFPPMGLDLPWPFPLEEGTTDHVTVRPSDCDVFEHANASSWVRWCTDIQVRHGETRVPHRVDVDYAGEALVGETLDVLHTATSVGRAFMLSRAGEPLCRVSLAYGIT